LNFIGKIKFHLDKVINNNVLKLGNSIIFIFWND